MSGNIANTSRDSFDITKLYDRVTLQQGVPIPDSDWNELNDVLRAATALMGYYALGDMRLPAVPGSSSAGYQISQALAPANNFQIDAGWALVKGVLVPTVYGDPPTDHDYEDDTNILGEGTVDTFAASVLTDTDKNWQSFHDLLATANHGPCRVKFTSGAEAGNSYTITAHTATTLTLSGGAPSPGDTYIVKPPALITPVGVRVDQVYVQVWWEDVNGDEDSNLVHPGLGVETAHRERRRWVVRVAENGTTPSTPAANGFGVRYVQLATLVRPDAQANINTAEIVNQPSQKPLGQYQDEFDASQVPIDATGWTAQAIQVNSGGGLGNVADSTFTALSTVQDFADEVDVLVARRRTYATLRVDNGAGRLADGAGQDAIDVALAANQHGPFLLNTEGSFGVDAKEFEIVANMATTRAPVFQGEQNFGEYQKFTTVKRRVAGVADARLHGSWRHIYFRTDDSTHYLVFGGAGRGSFHLNECGLESGHCKFDGSAFDMPWSVRDCVIRADTPEGITGHGHGIDFIEGTASDAGHGLFENCWIEGTAGAGARHAINMAVAIGDQPLNDLGSPYGQRSKPIVFRNCTIVSRSSDLGSALNMSGWQAPVLFENCVFYSPTGTTVATVNCVNSNVSFKNCLVVTEESDGVHIEDCFGDVDGLEIVTGTGTASTNPQALTARAVSDINLEYNLRNVTVHLNSACMRNSVPGTVYPLVNIGGVGNQGPGARPNSVTNVDGLRVNVIAATLGVQPVLALLGTNGGWAGQRYSKWAKVDVDFHGAEMNANAQASWSGALALIYLSANADDSGFLDGFSVTRFKHPDVAHNTERLVRCEVRARDVNIREGLGGTSTLEYFFSSTRDLSHAYIDPGTSNDFITAVATFTGEFMRDIDVREPGDAPATVFVSGTNRNFFGIRCQAGTVANRAFHASGVSSAQIHGLKAIGVANATTEVARIDSNGGMLITNSRVTTTAQAAGTTFVIAGDDTISSGTIVQGTFSQTGTNILQGDFLVY